MDRFKNLYNEYYTQLVYYATKILGDRHDAEDAVAEVFVNIIRRNKIDFIAQKPKAYLYIAIRNQCRNIIRDKRTEQKHISQYNTIEEELDLMQIKSQVIDQLYKAIEDHLPPKAKEMFLLRYVAGMGLKEIAKTLGKSPCTVHASLWQSILKIRTACKDTKINIQMN